MAEREGNIIQRGVHKTVEFTKPIDIVVLGAGVITGNPVLIFGGAIGLAGGEAAKYIIGPRKK